MTVAPLFVVALVVAAAGGPGADSPRSAMLSSQQKIAATQPLIRSATDCIVRAVAADPRSGTRGAAELGDVIVDSMRSCLAPVRAMIDAYDRCYGEGAGEAFFKGPYLDLLPTAVAAKTKPAAR